MAEELMTDSDQKRQDIHEYFSYYVARINVFTRGDLKPELFQDNPRTNLV